jgi:hypothetical protein
LQKFGRGGYIVSNRDFKIPSNLLEDKTLTPTQKMILTLFKNKQNLHSLDIAKGLFTRRKIIQDEINDLVERDRLYVSNGTNRVSYATIKGFDFESNPVTSIEDSTICLRSKHKNNNNNKSNSSNKILQSKIFICHRDMIVLAFKYWVDWGGTKHREGSGAYKNGMEMLDKLFKGKAFNHVRDDTIPRPLINKRLKFSLEDWQTSLDNVKIACESVAHRPVKKGKLRNYVKKIGVSNFIYNPFGKEGYQRSLFLQFLQTPQLIHSEVAIYKKLTTSLTKQFENANLRLQPTESQIIAAANIYGKIIHDYEWKYPSSATAARTFIEFIQSKYGKRYNPNWMTATWFKFELENYLDRQGLINIRE